MESPRKKPSTARNTPPPSPRAGSGVLHYQTFPTKPPSGKGRPPSFNLSTASPTRSYSSRRSSGAYLDSGNTYEEGDAGNGGDEGRGEGHKNSRLTGQLAVLAVISLAEQTALNSISPYLPDMTGGFPGVEGDKVGLYVGIIASCFAAAQVASEFPTLFSYWVGGGLTPRGWAI